MRRRSTGGKRPEITDEFYSTLSREWHPVCQGSGVVYVADSRLKLELPSAERGRYSNAQIDDYGNPLSPHFLWRPPLRMEVRARASLPAYPAYFPPTSAASITEVQDQDAQRYLLGTAGFGFWNTLVTLGGGRPRLPEAVWFFAASRPSNMALVPGSPGWGWKAQVVHSHRWGALGASLPTLATVGWARLTGRGEAAAGAWLHRFSGASEAHLAATLSDWHDYTLDWQIDSARFFVDSLPVLQVPRPPHGPLGFVAWIDNQYAVVTPRGSLRFGTVGSDWQWLEIDRLRIVSN
jgi:hypothetical protein